MRRISLVVLMAGLVGATGCTTVRPWQRGQLSEAPMQMEDTSTQRFERNVEVYREGAVGANGGKSGGGCGCS